MKQPKDPIILELRGYSLAELAKLYTISDRTFKKWIKPFKLEIGERQGRFYNISQVKIILAKLGVPDEISFTNNDIVEHKTEKFGTTQHKSA